MMVSAGSNFEVMLYDLDIDTTDNNEPVEPATLRRSTLFMFADRSDIPLMMFGGVATIAGSLGSAISAILMGRVFNVLSSLVNGEFESVGDYMQEIRLSTMALIALGAGSVLIVWATVTCWMHIGERHGIRARLHMLNTFLKKPISWYEENEKVMGDLTQINRCVEELRAGTAEATALVAQNTVATAALLGTSFYYSWSVTLIMICSSPLIIASVVVFSRLMEKYTNKENDHSIEAAKVLDWSLISAKIVRLFSARDIEYEKFSRKVTDCKDAYTKLSLVSSINMGIVRFIILCMFVQGFWFGSDQIGRGNVSSGDVLTCFTSCLMIGETLRSTLPQIITIQKAIVAINRIQSFVELRKDRYVKNRFQQKFNMEDSKHISIYPESCTGEIRFKNVDFSYPTRPDTKVLKNVSIDFPAGELTFIVGRSGSGKSTLSNLLLNFYSTSSGRVEVDGFSVGSLSERWLTDNITLVEQTCTLFNDTIKNNILMGCISSNIERVTEDELQEAVQFSLLDGVVRDLKDGLETMVGTGGTLLSGGQQQRVALARAKVRDTPILILDESVSALDIVMRDLVIEAVKTWRKGKTTIILTHEFNQIGPDDYVYLMEDGRVAEQGLRKDMENAQIFQYLVSLQDNYKPQEEDNMSSEMHIEESFLNRVANRISTQFLSSVNPLSYYQTHEMENSMAPRPRAMNRTIGGRKLDEEEIEERPSLSPIRYIVNRMMQTVEKKWALAFGIGIAVINGAAGPVFSYAFAHLLSGIVPQDDGVGSPSYLLKWSMIVLAVAFVDGASLFLKEFLLNYSAEVWVYGLRKQAFRKISKQGMAWFSKTINNAAEVNTLLMNDCRDLRSLISHFLGVITSVTVLCTMGLTWALVEGWKLSLVCISMLPAFVITSSLYAFLLQMSENEYKNAVATLESHLYETVKGYKTIRTLRLEKYFESKFHEKIDVLKRAASRRALYTGMGVAISNLLVFVVQGVLLYYGMKLVGDGEYDVMQLMTTFVLLVFSIMNCVQMINQIPDISRGQRAGTYVFNIIDLPDSDIESKGDTIPDLNTNATAQFKNVSFCYPSAPGQKVLKNVNLEINRDETVAIIGESGSGKSTLALLITRLYESKGTFFDEVDLNSIELKWLRSQISVVDQKASFFDGSIRDNVTYGLDNYDDEDLISALKLANIYEFIISLPEGLDTRIETSLISGGQAQRLSIARAVIRKPKLLILDECTSALDAESTSKIAQLVKENLKDISVMMITHSKEMMKVADRLVVLNNGRVVEEGTYQDLYRKRGEMFRIVTAGQNS